MRLGTGRYRSGFTRDWAAGWSSRARNRLPWLTTGEGLRHTAEHPVPPTAVEHPVAASNRATAPVAAAIALRVFVVRVDFIVLPFRGVDNGIASDRYPLLSARKSDFVIFFTKGLAHVLSYLHWRNTIEWCCAAALRPETIRSLPTHLARSCCGLARQWCSPPGCRRRQVLGRCDFPPRSCKARGHQEYLDQPDRHGCCLTGTLDSRRRHCRCLSSGESMVMWRKHGHAEIKATSGVTAIRHM